MTDFLDMGVYAPYVWSSYGVVALALVALACMSWRRARMTADRLRQLEADAPHRRRRRSRERDTNPDKARQPTRPDKESPDGL